MALILKRSILLFFFLGIFSSNLPLNTWAAVAVQAELASGTISQINADHSITLDNGKRYFPSRTELLQNLAEGKTVTIRYIAEEGGKNIFFECVFGLNALENKTDRTSAQRNNTQNY